MLWRNAEDMRLLHCKPLWIGKLSCWIRALTLGAGVNFTCITSLLAPGIVFSHISYPLAGSRYLDAVFGILYFSRNVSERHLSAVLVWRVFDEVIDCGKHSLPVHEYSVIGAHRCWYEVKLCARTELHRRTLITTDDLQVYTCNDA